MESTAHFTSTCISPYYSSPFSVAAIVCRKRGSSMEGQHGLWLLPMKTPALCCARRWKWRGTTRVPPSQARKTFRFLPMHNPECRTLTQKITNKSHRFRRVNPNLRSHLLNWPIFIVAALQMSLGPSIRV
jgi:hypothetical protein